MSKFMKSTFIPQIGEHKMNNNIFHALELYILIINLRVQLALLFLLLFPMKWEENFHC